MSLVASPSETGHAPSLQSTRGHAPLSGIPSVSAGSTTGSRAAVIEPYVAVIEPVEMNDNNKRCMSSGMQSSNNKNMYTKSKPIFILLICLSALFSSKAQTGGSPSLEGLWQLDSMEIKQITSKGDVIHIQSETLDKNILLQSEIYSSIQFDSFNCQLTTNNQNSITLQYSYDENKLFLKGDNYIKTYSYMITNKTMYIARDIEVMDKIDPSIKNFTYSLTLYYHKNK
jgi:hypothetical protein